MVASIPASRIVSVTPSVVSAGGTGLDLSGLILSSSSRVPIGTVQSFGGADSVGAFFGLSSLEYQLAIKYFAGYDGAPISPAALLFAQYPATAVSAYLKGGPVGGLTIAALQALSGVLSLTIDGEPVVSAAIDLSTASSFSAAAALITAGLGYSDGDMTVSTTSGSPTISVTAVVAGAVAVGDAVAGAGIPAGARVLSQVSGAPGGIGVYTISANASATATGVDVKFGGVVASYDSTWQSFVITSGLAGAASSITVAATDAFATALGLTAATGAIVSTGADVATPAGVMAAVVAQTQDFASFMTAFKPSDDDMVAFAEWNNGLANRYVYVLWDDNAALTTTDDSATALGRIKAANYAATLPMFDPIDGYNNAAAIMGIFASIDFTATNGRVNLALRSQSGLSAGVTNALIADQLLANGCNFYGAYATAAQGFVFFYDGGVTGPFKWSDTLVNEIWITNNFQLALMELLTAATSIPYNDAGYALIEASLQGPIDEAVNFGAIQPGVALSPSQIAAVNASAGAKVSDTIATRGWYLQVQPATPEVRAARGSPPILFWYTDGGSVQKIALNSAEVQ